MAEFRIERTASDQVNIWFEGTCAEVFRGGDSWYVRFGDEDDEYSTPREAIESAQRQLTAGKDMLDEALIETGLMEEEDEGE